MIELRKRLAPFLVLFEARYAPLLFAVGPQAYAVFKWLWEGSDHSTEALIFAIMGGIGYEFVYVGAIAWAEEKRFTFWTWITALISLVFSMFVAYYVYRSQGQWAMLHVGFPLVAFAYTMNMYTQTHETQPVSVDTDDILNIARQLRSNGLSYDKIAVELELPKSTIYKMLTSKENN